jgi:hypothetical protein
MQKTDSFVILPTVFQIEIVGMYYLVPTPESFEIMLSSTYSLLVYLDPSYISIKGVTPGYFRMLKHRTRTREELIFIIGKIIGPSLVYLKQLIIKGHTHRNTLFLNLCITK